VISGGLQLGLALSAAFVCGFAKAGVPGAGILVVPLMAEAYGGHVAIGATAPLLILGDCISVYFYRVHCDWPEIKKIAPAVLVGLLIGVVFLRFFPANSKGRDPLNILIGCFILLMLTIQLVRARLKENFAPTSKAGTAFTGLAAGFSTMVSNAAGPIMSIYLTATGLSKKAFMGTSSWYFLIFNLIKIPFFIMLSALDPRHPFINLAILESDFILFPGVLVGAVAGRVVLPFLNEKVFVNIVLVLAGIAAIKLILG
jgi:uncharacterized membrane protein YfcA